MILNCETIAAVLTPVRARPKLGAAFKDLSRRLPLNPLIIGHYCINVRQTCRSDCSSAQAESILIDLHLLPYKIPNCHSIKYQFADPDSRNHGQNSARSAQPVGRGRRHGADDARATARACAQRLGGECARCKRLLREREVLPDRPGSFRPHPTSI